MPNGTGLFGHGARRARASAGRAQARACSPVAWSLSRRKEGHPCLTCENVVLVHGGFVDESGLAGVYDLLKADGFNVSVVQNQTLSLESDVETTHNVLDLQDGPTILVGHP